MIAGMMPMALGIGEGGDQTAPLGRAVIGGLVAAHPDHPVRPAGRVRPGHGLGRPPVGVARPVRPGEPPLRPRRRRTPRGATMRAPCHRSCSAAACWRRRPAATASPPPPSGRGPGGARPSRSSSPRRRAVNRVVEQPGAVEPFEETRLFAKIPGFVKADRDRPEQDRRRHRPAIDIGSRVTAGQVLAELAVPELEEEAKQKEALVAAGRGRGRAGEEGARRVRRRGGVRPGPGDRGEGRAGPGPGPLRPLAVGGARGSPDSSRAG